MQTGEKRNQTFSGHYALYANHFFHAVIDSKKKIINIDARWPGATHDSRIFNNSQLKTVLETGKYKSCSIPTSALSFLMTEFAMPVIVTLYQANNIACITRYIIHVENNAIKVNSCLHVLN